MYHGFHRNIKQHTHFSNHIDGSISLKRLNVNTSIDPNEISIGLNEV